MRLNRKCVYIHRLRIRIVVRFIFVTLCLGSISSAAEWFIPLLLSSFAYLFASIYSRCLGSHCDFKQQQRFTYIHSDLRLINELLNVANIYIQITVFNNNNKELDHYQVNDDLLRALFSMRNIIMSWFNAQRICIWHFPKSLEPILLIYYWYSWTPPTSGSYPRLFYSIRMGTHTHIDNGAYGPIQ